MPLFFRHGKEFTGKPHVDTQGRPSTTTQDACTRCGGQGGSDAWKFTGYTCYQCGGSGRGKVQCHRLYTQEQLDRLNATAATKATKKQLAAEAKRAAEVARIAASRETFEARHGALLAEAAKFADQNEFIADVCRKAHERADLTERQEIALRDAIKRLTDRAVVAAGSSHVGAVGERATFTVRTERVFAFDGHFGRTYITTMRDENGNAIVSKGAFQPMGDWDRNSDRTVYDTTTVYQIKGTIKEHGIYNGEKQTVVSRVKQLDAQPEKVA